jgi:hypothetical protein
MKRQRATARANRPLALVVSALAFAGSTLATGSAAPGPAAAADDIPTTTVSYSATDVQPLVPSRLLDTREGNGAPVGKVGPDSTIDLQVAGRGGVPAVGVGAVVLNVTATEPTADGYVTVFPTGIAHPLASNLNLTAHQTVPNLVVVKVGVGGRVSLFNQQGATHLIVDVSGWFPEGSGLRPVAPTRVLDTRDGTGAPVGSIGPGSTAHLQIAGRAGLPAAGVGAVVLNVTVTEPTQSGFITAYPSGTPQPLASNLNFTSGLTVPNLVITKVGADGAVDLFNSAGQTQLVADVAGWFPASSALRAIEPVRLLDTRSGNGAPVGAVPGGSSIDLQITGREGLPATGMAAVVINVTATEATADGFVTVYPTGVTRPTASNLNVRPGQTVPNLAVVKVGASGRISLFNSAGSIHLVADVVGWFPTADSDTVTMQPFAGTVIVGEGDVVSATRVGGGGTVVLAATSDVPDVGGFLVMRPGDPRATTVSGRVTERHTDPGGMSTLQIAPARLDEMFADLDIDSDNLVGLLTPPALRTEAEAGCGPGISGGGVSLDFGLGGFSGSAQVDLAEKSARAELHATMTASVSVSVAGSYSCSFSWPTVLVATGPWVISIGFRATFSVNASLSGSATVTSPVTIGFAYLDGQGSNLSSIDFDGSGDATAAAAVSATASFEGFLAAQLLGVVGPEVAFGPQVGIEATPTLTNGVPGVCVEINASVVFSINLNIGQWFLAVSVSIGSLTLGPWNLYRFGDCEYWEGTITQVWKQKIPGVQDVLYVAEYDIGLNDTTQGWSLEQALKSGSGCGELVSTTTGSGSADVGVNVFVTDASGTGDFKLQFTSTGSSGDITTISDTCYVGDGGVLTKGSQTYSGPFFPYPLSGLPCLSHPSIDEDQQVVVATVENTCAEGEITNKFVVSLRHHPCDTSVDSDDDGTPDCNE